MAIRGTVDEMSHARICGWAWNPAKPRTALVLVIRIDGLQVARVVANAYRPDLEAAGIGDGRHSFVLDAGSLQLPITPAMVHVQVEGTGEDLTHSPSRLACPMEFDAVAQRAMTALLDSPGSDQVLQDRAQYLAGQVDRLLRRVAERQSNRAARASASSRKWRWRPQDGPEPAPPPLRALVIDAWLPKPGRDAGSNAIMSHMRSLQRLGYEVTFVPIDMRDGGGAATLLAMGVAAICEPWAGSVEEVLRRQAGGFDLVYLHRVDAASIYAALARRHLPQARLLYSVADLHSLRLMRQAHVEDRPELVPHANHMLAQELAAAASCHVVVTHSAVEAALLRQRLPLADIHVVPWAIPVRPTPAAFDARHGVAFVGSFGHDPNLDAALWLMDEIMPLVWRQSPQITCCVAGSAMPATIKRKRDKRITTLADVADLDTVLGRVRLTVAPLAYGAGLKGKVADSLAAGVPCVCTPIAAEGFGLPAPLQDCIAATAEGLAAAIVRMHASREAFDACRDAGLALIAQAFSEASVDAGLLRAVRRASNTPRATQLETEAVLTQGVAVTPAC